jgi:hypothetical protein
MNTSCIVHGKNDSELRILLEQKVGELLKQDKKICSLKAKRIYQKGLFGIAKFGYYEVIIIWN